MSLNVMLVVLISFTTIAPSVGTECVNGDQVCAAAMQEHGQNLKMSLLQKAFQVTGHNVDTAKQDRANTADNTNGEPVNNLFDRLDANGDGYIDRSELETALAAGLSAMTSDGSIMHIYLHDSDSNTVDADVDIGPSDGLGSGSDDSATPGAASGSSGGYHCMQQHWVDGNDAEIVGCLSSAEETAHFTDVMGEPILCVPDATTTYLTSKAGSGRPCESTLCLLNPGGQSGAQTGHHIQAEEYVKAQPAIQYCQNACDAQPYCYGFEWRLGSVSVLSSGWDPTDTEMCHFYTHAKDILDNLQDATTEQHSDFGYGPESTTGVDVVKTIFMSSVCMKVRPPAGDPLNPLATTTAAPTT